ncbi:MAG: bifunctional 3,4-dihydroxy-2-butanone-4-phosphate synthase/GTP cyclohydrolase II [Candidatus Celaenobacter polaris]|nr:bifunctional 3,4-dihydroxy-2-butanone-4-phosphate synthase/GTP cyclohydrolase II [Candidatus Celaenobacter polaris]
MFDTIEEAIKDFREGKFVIIVDDEKRENEGDLVIAAEKATPEKINFMITHAKGLVCLPIVKQRLDELNIHPMVSDYENSEVNKCNFTISIDSKEGITTGISAFDRAKTINDVLDYNKSAKDFSRPGHIFPLQYEEGGVLKRAGHTEASVDIAKAAGMFPAAVICEMINPDGTMSRVPQLKEFSQKYNIKFINIQDFIKYRLKTERLVKNVAHAMLPTKFGEFRIYIFLDALQGQEHIAIIKGHIADQKNILVRVHSQCITGDIFHSIRCDCNEQLHNSLRMIEQEGRGVLVYMRQEGRGIGLTNKIKAYKLQEQGLDTVEANINLGFAPDLRDYGIGAQILKELGLSTIRLITNNPKKIVGLTGYGLQIVERIPIQVKPNIKNRKYLETKKIKLGHMLDL